MTERMDGARDGGPWSVAGTAAKRMSGATAKTLIRSVVIGGVIGGLIYVAGYSPNAAALARGVYAASCAEAAP